MKKPHIWYVHGMWWCATVKGEPQVYVGASPSFAYWRWAIWNGPMSHYASLV